MATTEKKMANCDFTWDDCIPPEATSYRGWLFLDNHPERGGEYNHVNCVGNYLSYRYPNDIGTRGPNGETIHAVAYIYRYFQHVSPSNIGLGSAWFNTISEAKRFIEGNIRAYFGLPR